MDSFHFADLEQSFDMFRVEDQYSFKFKQKNKKSQKQGGGLLYVPQVSN